MSLKEIKSRIQSVKSTQKITSAMKMVSAAKLHKAERAVNSFLPYQQRMNDILINYLSAEEEINSVYTKIRDVERVGIVVFASNSSLCGSYNSVLIKRLQQSISTHRDVRKEDIIVFPVGKKVYQACVDMEIKVAGEFEGLANEPTYEKAEELAEILMNMFVNREIDRIKVIYFHFESKSVQKLAVDTYLPFELSYYHKGDIKADYLIEPSKEELISTLIPMVLHLRIFAAALDALASENAARTIAMQIATDNADDLLQELTVQYNKSRQQAITNELLDIIGGSFK
ncbi:MAG TPA: ATP synthase F1 subunit gamma [Paludibacter sp.]|nr:ATP synthase F1 subunit gamma [Paludibacter sp.]